MTFLMTGTVEFRKFSKTIISERADIALTTIQQTSTRRLSPKANRPRKERMIVKHNKIGKENVLSNT